MTTFLDKIGDKFEILHKISEGGMGLVYKVRHRLLDQISVIKIIRPQHAADEDLRQRFLNEARTASRLRHPNIAAIQDFFLDEEGTAYLVMEYIDGITLKERLADSGALPLGLALEVARQSLEALSYLHHEGYLHRDVSPDNLMLTRGFDGTPVIKLIDLGIAKQLHASVHLTTTGMFVGKAKYSSPEQIRGSTDLDPRSDIYSFGVMFYELLTGRCPVEGDNVSTLVAGHLLQPPVSFEVSDPGGRVPHELRRIVLTLLEKEPEKRVASAQDLIRRLAPLQQDPASPTAELDALDGASRQVGVASGASDEGLAGPTIVAGKRRFFFGPKGRKVAGPKKAGPSSKRARRWALAATLLLVAGILGGWLLSGGGERDLRGRGTGGQSTAQGGGAAAAREDFRLAVVALESQRWTEAARLFRQAAAGDPRERAEPVKIGPGSSEPYLPYYFLGLALYEMRNYVLALDAFKTSEEQGVIQGTAKYPRLRQLQAESDSVAVEPAIRRAEATLASAGEYASMVRQMLGDAGLEPVWQDEPESLKTAETLLADLERAQQEVETARLSRDLRALDDAYTSIREVKDGLVDLTNRLLEPR